MRHNRTKFADFSPSPHRFGVACRPLTCDCNLSWQSDMFLLYIKVGVRRQFDRSWQIFDKVSSISQSREVWILGRPLSATRHSHLGLRLLLTLFTIATFVWNLHTSLSALWWVSFFQPGFPKTNTTDVVYLEIYMFNIWQELCRNSPRWWLPYIQISSVVRSRVDGSEKNWKDWKRNEEVEALLGNNDRPVIFLQTGESLLRGEPIRWVGCTGKARPTYTGGKLRASADMAIHPRLHTVHTSWHKWRLVEIESSTLDEEILDRLQSLLTDGFQWLEKTLEKANRSLPNNTG